jgi:putative hemolysin
VADPDLSPFHPVLTAGIAAVILYRALMAALLEAFHALPSIQRRRMLEEEAFQDALLARLLERPHALGLGITLFNQILLVLLLNLAWPLWAVIPGGAWTIVVLTLVYVWLADLVLPTLLTAGSPGRWIVWLFPFYTPFHRMLAPLVAPLARYVERQEDAQDRVRDAEDEQVSEDAVTALLEEGEAEGILEADDRELIRNVVGFGNTTVREVMTPRTSIHGVPLDAHAEQLWTAFRESRHSRLPVYAGTIDHIVGLVLLKDLMQLDPGHSLDLGSLLKTPIFVPESKPSLDTLRELQRARTQLAVVVDEFGSLSGIVTVEDLLEEVFGEIREEHEGHPEIQTLPDGEYLVAGHVHVEELERILGCTWEREGFDTISGLMMSRLGRVPQENETVETEGAQFLITRMQGSRVAEVRVRAIPS